jgi:hypothetical protein
MTDLRCDAQRVKVYDWRKKSSPLYLPNGLFVWVTARCAFAI